MKHLVIYIHGKGGSAKEAEHYQKLLTKSDVIGFDYQSQNPWDARTEFSHFYELHSRGYDAVTLIANSIGAYFSMSALAEKKISTALFISPIVDMEKVIANMMLWAGVTEEELKRKKEIPTEVGETLSWNYLCYVREHPLGWHTPTYILYGTEDYLTSRETITSFAEKIGADLTIMEKGEHWFHTDEQMDFLDRWIKSTGISHMSVLSREHSGKMYRGKEG